MNRIDFILDHIGGTELDIIAEFYGKSADEIIAIVNEIFPTEENTELIQAILDYLDIAVLSTRDAARILGMSDAHIRRMIGQGKLPARKLGHDWLINPQNLVNMRRQRAPKKGT